MTTHTNSSLAMRRERHHPVARQVERNLGRIAWLVRTSYEIWRQWHSNERCMRALAELDGDDLPNLSEAGRKLRREARRQLRTH